MRFIANLLKWGVARFADVRGARLVRPDGAVIGVPYVLELSNVPRVLIPSGIANASGQLTLNAALPWVLAGNVWIYVPAGVVVGDSTGGWYQAVFSTAAVCQLVGNPATTPGAYTQTTSQVTFKTVNVPGGTIGPNGALRVSQVFGMTGSSNGKIVQSFFNTSIFGANATVAGNFVSYGMVNTIRNLGVENRQMAQNAASDTGSSPSAMAHLAIDTSVARPLACTGSLSTAAVAANEYLALIGMTVEVLPGA